jgi:hypothetical protein
MINKKEKSIIDRLKQIRNGEGWILGIIITAFSGLGVFAVNNYSLPRDNERIESLEEYMKTDRSEKAVMRSDVDRFKQDLKEIKGDMKEGFKALSDKMDENNRIVRIVKENTK